MKKKLTTLFTLLIAFLCSLSAQKPQPLQIQTVNDSTYVVEYIPLPVAQKNVAAQLTQVDKQLQTVDRQIADLVKKRDELMKQQAALQFAQKQLDQAAAPPPPPPAKTAPATAQPPKEKKAKGKKN